MQRLSRKGVVRRLTPHEVHSAHTGNDIVYPVRNDGPSDNHAIGYSLLSYICAWLRCYHPLEFITSYLNNAANNDDIKAGSELAEQYKIQIVSPKYGESTDTYFFDREKNVITKGVGSIRDMNNAVARALYDLSQTHRTESFIDLLRLMDSETTLRANQLDHLIKIDYFSDYGNVPTLTRILQFYDFMKRGTAKKISKDKLSPEMERIIAPFATDKNAKGQELKAYTIIDMDGLLHEAEEEIRNLNLPDLDLKVKIQNSMDLLGYIGVRTGKPEDRCHLIIGDVMPQRSKQTGDIWGYRIGAQSIGSGKSARLTVRANVFDKQPIGKGDIIRHQPRDLRQNDKGYWTLYNYVRE